MRVMAGRDLGTRLAAALMLSWLCACSADGKSEAARDSLTTNTDSQSLADKDQRLAFLARYLRSKSPIVDAEFVIRYHDNSKGPVPGPSDWDIRAVLQVERDASAWNAGWVPCAARGNAQGTNGTPPPGADTTWAQPLLGRRTQWQRLRATPRCYRNPRTPASFVILYEQDNLVLYRNASEPILPTPPPSTSP